MRRGDGDRVRRTGEAQAPSAKLVLDAGRRPLPISAQQYPTSKRACVFQLGADRGFVPDLVKRRRSPRALQLPRNRIPGSIARTLPPTEEARSARDASFVQLRHGGSVSGTFASARRRSFASLSTLHSFLHFLTSLARRLLLSIRPRRPSPDVSSTPACLQNSFSFAATPSRTPPSSLSLSSSTSSASLPS